MFIYVLPCPFIAAGLTVLANRMAKVGLHNFLFPLHCCHGCWVGWTEHEQEVRLTQLSPSVLKFDHSGQDMGQTEEDKLIIANLRPSITRPRFA